MHADNPRHHNLALMGAPVPSGCVHIMLEARTLDDLLHSRHRMDKCAKRIPPHSPCHILQSNPRSDVPDVAWIRKREAATRESRRFIKQPLVFWITTDDPIQRDHIGGKKPTGNLYKITVDESGRVGLPSTRRLC